MKKPLNEKAIKAQMRLFVIEHFITTYFAALCAQANPSDPLEGFERWEKAMIEGARKTTLPRFDPAQSDLYSAELEAAVARSVGSGQTETRRSTTSKRLSLFAGMVFKYLRSKDRPGRRVSCTAPVGRVCPSHRVTSLAGGLGRCFANATTPRAAPGAKAPGEKPDPSRGRELCRLRRRRRLDDDA